MPALAWSLSNALSYSTTALSSCYSSSRCLAFKLSPYPIYISSTTYPPASNPISTSLYSHPQNPNLKLAWSQQGTHFASVDENGRVVVWRSENFINRWSPLYEFNIGQPVVCLAWINKDRNYVHIPSVPRPSDPNDPSDEYIPNTLASSASAPRIKRGPFRGPRNPHGQLAFVILTADGQVVVFFQHESQIFSKSATRVPLFSGLADAHPSPIRISKGEFALCEDGRLVMAIHCADSHPRCIGLYEIEIDLLAGEPGSHSLSQMLLCKPITRLNMSPIHFPLSIPLSPSISLMLNAPVQHIRIIPATSNLTGFRIVVINCALEKNEINICSKENGERPTKSKCLEGNEKHVTQESSICVWETRNSSVRIHDSFWNLGTAQAGEGSNNMSLHLLASIHFPTRLVTSIAVLRHSKIIALGYDSGHTEFRDSETLELVTTPLLDILMPDPNGEPSMDIDKDGWNAHDESASAVLEIASSPNDASLALLRSSGAVEIWSPPATVFRLLDVESAEQIPNMVTAFATKITLNLLNGGEPLDLLQSVVRICADGGPSDLPELILERVHAYYSHALGLSSVSTLGGIFNSVPSSILHHVLGFQVSVFRNFPSKTCQYVNTIAALHIHSMTETFAACLQNFEETKDWLGQAIRQPTECQTSKSSLCPVFDRESYWSLIPLAIWVLDLCGEMIRGLYLTMEVCREGETDESTRPSALGFWLYTPSRACLRQLILLIHQCCEQIAADAKVHLTVTSREGNETGSEGQMRNQIEFVASYLNDAMNTGWVKLSDVKDFVEEIDDLIEENSSDVPDRQHLDSFAIVHGTAPKGSTPILSKLGALIQKFFGTKPRQRLPNSSIVPMLSSSSTPPSPKSVSTSTAVINNNTTYNQEKMEANNQTSIFSPSSASPNESLSAAVLPRFDATRLYHHRIPPLGLDPRSTDDWLFGGGDLDNSARFQPSREEWRKAVDGIDVVRKVPLLGANALRQCVRCLQFSFLHDPNPTAPIRTGSSTSTQPETTISPQGGSSSSDAAPVENEPEARRNQKVLYDGQFAWQIRFSRSCVCGGLWRRVDFNK